MPLPPDSRVWTPVHRHQTRTHRAKLLEFTDANLHGKPDKLGKGEFNTVYGVNIWCRDGTLLEGAFKAFLDGECAPVAQELGISPSNPRTDCRNFATLTLAKRLGFDVITDMWPGRFQGSLNGEPVLAPGLVMQKARGESAKHAGWQLLNQPSFVREVTKLQLLDHLTGQGDRHRNNYFVKMEPDGRVTVTGIDNDQCFGERPLDPDGIRWTGEKSCPFRGTRLPPVVDTQMAAAIDSLKPRELRELLETFGMSGREIFATMWRMALIKRHIEGLAANARVIEPDQWGDPKYLALLNPANSYAARDLRAAMPR